LRKSKLRESDPRGVSRFFQHSWRLRDRNVVIDAQLNSGGEMDVAVGHTDRAHLRRPVF
jgi:hypothetical protein